MLSEEAASSRKCIFRLICTNTGFAACLLLLCCFFLLLPLLPSVVGFCCCCCCCFLVFLLFGARETRRTLFFNALLRFSSSFFAYTLRTHTLTERHTRTHRHRQRAAHTDVHTNTHTHRHALWLLACVFFYCLPSLSVIFTGFLCDFRLLFRGFSSHTAQPASLRMFSPANYNNWLAKMRAFC